MGWGWPGPAIYDVELAVADLRDEALLVALAHVPRRAKQRERGVRLHELAHLGSKYSQRLSDLVSIAVV